MHGPFFISRQHIIQVGAHHRNYEPLSENVLGDLMPTAHSDDDQEYGSFYNTDNRLLFGGRARFALSSATSDARSGKILEQNMLALFPQYATPGIDPLREAWSDMTADRLPRASSMKACFTPWAIAATARKSVSPVLGQIMASGAMDGHPTPIRCRRSIGRQFLATSAGLRSCASSAPTIGCRTGCIDANRGAAGAVRRPSLWDYRACE